MEQGWLCSPYLVITNINRRSLSLSLSLYLSSVCRVELHSECAASCVVIPISCARTWADYLFWAPNCASHLISTAHTSHPHTLPRIETPYPHSYCTVQYGWSFNRNFRQGFKCIPICQSECISLCVRHFRQSELSLLRMRHCSQPIKFQQRNLWPIGMQLVAHAALPPIIFKLTLFSRISLHQCSLICLQWKNVRQKRQLKRT